MIYMQRDSYQEQLHCFKTTYSLTILPRFAGHEQPICHTVFNNTLKS